MHSKIYNDVTWASWRLKPPATYLLVPQLVQPNNKGNTKLSLLALCVGTSPVSDEFLSQRASNAESVSDNAMTS